MRVPLIFFWQYMQEAKKRGMTLEQYLDSEIERLAAEANMSVEEYVKNALKGLEEE